MTAILHFFDHASSSEELIITRHFAAPRMQVWKAWTEPERFKQWWGPKNFTTPYCRIDLRPGGTYLNCMRSPDGREYWSTGIYREVQPPSLLFCTDSFADADGNIVPASHYGMGGDWPLELLVTLTLREQYGGTRLTLRHAGIPAGEMRDLTETGWQESFDKLADYLAAEKRLPAGCSG
ncbi:MAG: SRPBCC domain-containing protein [Desulfobulbaceae bacterium]|nr:MAG: SRPBCC domain-containing protein [Desulfobulbaceae bacterium]